MDEVRFFLRLNEFGHFNGINLMHSSLSTAKIRFGIPGSQSLIEGINGSLKDEFDFTKKNTTDLLDNFRFNFRNRLMRECEDWGFSLSP